MTTDAKLKEAVVDALGYESAITPGSVRVEVQNGYATLSGCVDSSSLRGLAERVAERTVGVRAVSCEISVARPESAIIPTN